MRRIVCAALRRKDTGDILCGPRHFDEIMRSQIRNIDKAEWVEAEQGFVDNKGVFLSRREAYPIAQEAKQFFGPMNSIQSNVLYSEHLY